MDHITWAATFVNHLWIHVNYSKLPLYSNLGSQRILIFFLKIYEDKRELLITMLAVLRVGSLLLGFEQAFFQISIITNVCDELDGCCIHICLCMKYVCQNEMVHLIRFFC